MVVKIYSGLALWEVFFFFSPLWFSPNGLSDRRVEKCFLQVSILHIQNRHSSESSLSLERQSIEIFYRRWKFDSSNICNPISLIFRKARVSIDERSKYTESQQLTTTQLFNYWINLKVQGIPHTYVVTNDLPNPYNLEIVVKLEPSLLLAELTVHLRPHPHLTSYLLLHCPQGTPRRTLQARQCNNIISLYFPAQHVHLPLSKVLD